jgi:hypothetical protein
MAHVHDRRKERVLEVTMPDGSIWQVSDDMIARAWAANLARRAAREEDADPQALFQQEYDRTMQGDDTLLLERAAQLYWFDVEGEATQVRQAGTPHAHDHQWAYEREWLLGDKRIVP